MSTLETPSPESPLSPVASADPEAIRAAVREKYGAAARAVSSGAVRSGDCGCSCCGPADGQRDPVTSGLYAAEEVAEVPPDAFAASLGCGNPTLLAALHPGEVVLDLGAGGGIDALLAARRVGPEGRVYGLDMTREMLELFRENVRRAGAENVEVLEGEIEVVPLPDAAVDVVISNCVLNLSADKPRALAEAFRVLRPGGRFAVSDIVLRERLPEAARASLPLWSGCVAGALEDAEYRSLLAEIGFTGIEIEPTRVYTAEDVRALLEGTGVDPAHADDIDGKVESAFVRATRPLA